MPVKKCQESGKDGYKWGDAGKCYTYTTEEERKDAIQKAIKQGVAVGDLKLKNGRSEYVKARVADVKNKPTEIKRIAEDLFISERTVRRDLEN